MQEAGCAADADWPDVWPVDAHTPLNLTGSRFELELDPRRTTVASTAGLLGSRRRSRKGARGDSE